MALLRQARVRRATEGIGCITTVFQGGGGRGVGYVFYLIPFFCFRLSLVLLCSGFTSFVWFIVFRFSFSFSLVCFIFNPRFLLHLLFFSCFVI